MHGASAPRITIVHSPSHSRRAGTVFECYPYFKERMEGAFQMLLGERKAAGINLVLAKDGSGVGAAIIAAIA